MTESKPAFCFVVLKKFDKNILFVYFEKCGARLLNHSCLRTAASIQVIILVPVVKGLSRGTTVLGSDRLSLSLFGPYLCI